MLKDLRKVLETLKTDVFNKDPLSIALCLPWNLVRLSCVLSLSAPTQAWSKVLSCPLPARPAARSLAYLGHRLRALLVGASSHLRRSRASAAATRFTSNMGGLKGWVRYAESLRGTKDL